MRICNTGTDIRVGRQVPDSVEFPALNSAAVGFQIRQINFKKLKPRIC